MTAKLVSGRVQPDDDISKALYTQFRKVNLSDTLGDLARIFDRDHYALVTTEQLQYGPNLEPSTRSVVTGIVTRIDLLNYISHGQDSVGNGASPLKK